MLSKLESTCDVVVNHGDEVDPKIVLFILHNIAVCQQRLTNNYDAIAYIDASLYNVNKSNSEHDHEGSAKAKEIN